MQNQCIPCTICSCNCTDELLNLCWPFGWGIWSCGWDYWPCGLNYWPCDWGNSFCWWDHKSHKCGCWESEILREVPKLVAAPNDFIRITVTAAKGTSLSHYTVNNILQYYNSIAMRNYAFILSTVNVGMHIFISQKQYWFRYTLWLLLCRRYYCKRNCSLARALILLLLLGGDIESNPGPSKEWHKKQAQKQKYVLQREEILEK